MDMINFLNIKKLEKKNSLGVLAADKGITEPFKIYSHNQIAYLFIIIQNIIKR